MYDGSVKACFDKTIGNAKLASPVKASFDAPTLTLRNLSQDYAGSIELHGSQTPSTLLIL